MVRCLRLAIDSKKVVISSRLRTTGSLNGIFGNGKSSSLQGRLSHAVEETQCADRWTEAAGGQLALLPKMDEPGPDLFGAE